MRASEAPIHAPGPLRVVGSFRKAALLVTAAAFCLLAFQSSSQRSSLLHSSWSAAVSGARKQCWESTQCQQLLDQAPPPPVLKHLLVMITFKWDITHLAFLALVRPGAAPALCAPSGGGPARAVDQSKTRLRTFQGTWPRARV